MFESLFQRQLKVPVHQVIGQGCQIQGEVAFQGGLMIAGTVAGELKPQGEACSVTVDQGGRLQTGVLEVDLVVVNGHLASTAIRARRVVLGASAVVEGDIHAQAIEIHTGARFDGRVACRGVAASATKPVSEGELAGAGA